jgi:serine/threonine protein kinase
MTPNFSSSLADFGVAKVFHDEKDSFTTRNRGTEFIKSPEMLIVANTPAKSKFGTRKKTGASAASDVWSLGCLLFELVSGEFLFYETDFAEFFTRVTYADKEVIPPEKRKFLDNNRTLVEFLEFVLHKNPVFRPTLPDVIRKFEHVRAAIMQQYFDTSSSVPRPRTPKPMRLTKTVSNKSIQSVSRHHDIVLTIYRFSTIRKRIMKN